MSATGKRDERLLAKLLLSTALVAVSAGYVHWQNRLTAPRPQSDLAAAPAAPSVPVQRAAAATAPVSAPVASAEPAAPAPPAASSATRGPASEPAPAHLADQLTDGAKAFVPPPPAPVAEGPAATAIYAAAGSHIEDGEYTSHPQDFQWGTVQIRAQIKNGVFTDIQFLQIPDHRPQSADLTQLSKPILLHETIHDQKAGVDIVSTATYTSMAYQDALTDVIVQATRQ